MQPESVAETFPRTYRLILDTIEHLAERGFRDEATRLRTQAIVTYAGPWDPRHLRRLEEILTHAEAAAGTREPPSGLRLA